MAEGPFTDPRRRGGCDGGYMVWEQERGRWRDWIDTAAATMAYPGELRGVTYEPALGGAILAWGYQPKDIVPAEWAPGGAGKWALIEPPGEPRTTRWHQYDSTPGLNWHIQYKDLPADSVFCASIYREATPKREGTVYEGDLPFYYTGIEFGGRFMLVLPKWRPAELWTRVGGQWRKAMTTPWRHSELYNDSRSQKELMIAVMPLDGMILFKNSYTDQGVVYAEEQPIEVPAGPIVFRGNGGAAYVGMHDIAFSTDEDNILAARQASTFDMHDWDERPMPVLHAATPAGTSAELQLVDETLAPLDWEYHWGKFVDWKLGGKEEPWRVRYLKLLRLRTTDRRKTPVVRFVGVVSRPRNMADATPYVDITDDVREVSGHWEVDLHKRIITQRYDIELENADGQWRDLTGARRVRLALGYAGEPITQRAVTWAIPASGDVENIGEASVTLRTLDRLTSLFETPCEHRAPQDGEPVWRAILEALTWGGAVVDERWFSQGPPSKVVFGGVVEPYPDEIGTLHMSGNTIPTSRFAAAQALAETGEGTAPPSGDDEQRAVAQPRPNESVGEYIVRLMRFDWMTFLMYGADGMFHYAHWRDLMRPVFHFEETPEGEEGEEGDWRPVMRGGFTHDPQGRTAKTSILVIGRDRATRRVLRALAVDWPALVDGESERFVGFDRREQILDEALNTRQLVNKRARWEFAKQTGLQARAQWECLGQPGLRPLDVIMPLEMRTAGGRRPYLVAALHDRMDAERRYEGQVDAIRLDGAWLEMVEELEGVGA